MPQFVTIDLPIFLFALLFASLVLYRKLNRAKKAQEALRKKTEEELLKSKLSYQTLTETSPVGIFHTDASGYTTYVNPRWTQITGMAAEKALGYGWLDAVHPDDRDDLNKAWQEATSGKVSSTYEYRFIRPDGGISWVQGEAVPEKGINNEIIGYVGTATDITYRKKAELQIINERNLSDSIINSLPAVFYLYTQEGKFLRWNGNFEKVTLYSAVEIMQMHPLDFFDADEKEAIAQKINNVFVLGEDHVQANFFLKTKEKIPYYFTGKAIMYNGKPCLLGVGIDFSDRLKAQEKIKEASRQLRELAAHLQNVREEERIDIARDIHDDLGQQLTAVKIALFRLAKQVNGNEATEKNIQGIIDMIGKGIESIRRISTQLRPGILDDLGLVEAMKWQTEEFEKRFAIPVSTQFSDLPDVIDPDVAINVFRIFQETLTNIIRHAAATRVEVLFEADREKIYLRVSDNGRGLNMEEIKTKRTLGLLGMQERAYMIGGHFAVNGRPGEGTTIEIEAPVNKKSNAYALFNC